MQHVRTIVEEPVDVEREVGEQEQAVYTRIAKSRNVLPSEAIVEC